MFTYKRNYPTRKFCSVHCSTRSAGKAYRERKGRLPAKQTRECLVCDLPFTTTRRWKKYCCKACRAYATHQRRGKHRSDPSPELIARRAAAIRGKWADEEYAQRRHRMMEHGATRPAAWG